MFWLENLNVTSRGRVGSSIMKLEAAADGEQI